MQKFERVFHIIDFISEWTGKIFSFLIAGVVAVIVYEVTARYVFNRPTMWSNELTTFLFGAAMIVGGAYTLRYGAHVRVDVVYSRWSPRTQAIFDMATSVFFFTFCILLLWKGAEVGWPSVLRRETSWSDWRPPIYPLRMMIPVGASLILLQGMAEFIRNILTAVTGRVHRPPIEEELEMEKMTE